MVEYKKRLINLKGGGTRSYYSKQYASGKEVRVKKEEYLKKTGGDNNEIIYIDKKLFHLDKYFNFPYNPNNPKLKLFVEAYSNAIKSNDNITQQKEEKNKRFKNYISTYVPSGSWFSSCEKGGKLFDVKFYKIEIVLEIIPPNKNGQSNLLIKMGMTPIKEKEYDNYNKEYCINKIENSYIKDNKFFDFVELTYGVELFRYAMSKNLAEKIKKRTEELKALMNDPEKYLKDVEMFELN